MTMNSLAATLIFNDTQHLDLTTLREMVLSAFAASLLADGDEDENGQPVLPIQPLVRAYVTLYLARADYLEKDVKLVSGAEAEQAWKSGVLAGYRVHFAKTQEGDESLGWWPDALDIGREYPPKLLADLGYLQGWHDGRSTKAAFEYFARERAMQMLPSPQTILDGHK
jgi:hypothetical protein